MNQDVANTLQSFAPVSLAQLDAVRLQNRVDTKFLLNQRLLMRALQAVSAQYHVLMINDTALNRYQTLYFDTPDFGMYMDHHNGAGNRYKVRSRLYVETGTSFFEVKQKNNKARTIKRRQQTAEMVTNIDEGARTFLAKAYPDDPTVLEPKLRNSFTRITLASKANEERLTLDLGITFEVNGIQVSFPDIVIAEVKQARFTVDSDFFREMRRFQVRRIGFSKYCAGIARMYPEIKQNLFKERMLVLNKLSGLRKY